ncbi:MAG: glycosyltransferase family 4 protein [Chloroflexi bacterium]|nr:glycosyltransferase family 4 protein [Chloroflexota bacterium]
MIGIASCWPDDVATGSGTTVSQRRLLDALERAGSPARIVYTSRFATSSEGLERRESENRAFGERVGDFNAVIGIDGEGWLWAREDRRPPLLAFCEAVLADVLPFERGEQAALLERQAEWEGAAARCAEVVVARSAYGASCVARHYGIEPGRVNVVPIPFDVASWQAQLPRLQKEPLVLAVGHLYPRKNYRPLIDAWPAVSRAYPEARLVVIGVGPEQAAFEEANAELAHFTWLGHVSYGQLLELYARARVFCHPSLQENFGVAVVEALASGCAVVTHRQAAVLENTAGVVGAWAVDARVSGELETALLDALSVTQPWDSSRLAGLEARLDPASIGRQVARLADSARRNS